MFAFIQDVPIDATVYERIRSGIGDTLPDGLVIHLALERPEGGLRYIDVWQSEQQAEQFVEDRVHPVVHALLREVFDDDLPPEPPSTTVNVVHAWGHGMP